MHHRLPIWQMILLLISSPLTESTVKKPQSQTPLWRWLDVYMGGGTPYLHLFHEFKHLLRWQTGYCSADGLWGLLWLDAVSIRRLNNGGSCSQTCARQK